MFDNWNSIVFGSILLLSVSLLLMLRVVDWLNAAASVSSPEYHSPSAIQLIRSEIDRTEKEINDEAARLERRQMLRESSREASRASSATSSPIAKTVSFVDSFPAVQADSDKDTPRGQEEENSDTTAISPFLRNRKAKHEKVSNGFLPDDATVKHSASTLTAVTVTEEEAVRLTHQLLTLLTSNQSLPTPPYQRAFHSSIVQYATLLVGLPHADLVRYSSHICEQWISAKGFDGLRILVQRDSEQGFDNDQNMLELTTSEKAEVVQVSQAAETILHILIPLVWSA